LHVNVYAKSNCNQIENEGCGLFTSTSNLSEELDEDFTLQVYPNPNNGFFFVEFTQQETADVTFNFYDPLGKLINSETIINTKLILKEFNLPTLQNGVIIMNIKSKNINISRKVIIQN